MSDWKTESDGFLEVPTTTRKARCAWKAALTSSAWVATSPPMAVDESRYALTSVLRILESAHFFIKKRVSLKIIREGRSTLKLNLQIKKEMEERKKKKSKFFFGENAHSCAVQI